MKSSVASKKCSIVNSPLPPVPITSTPQVPNEKIDEIYSKPSEVKEPTVGKNVSKICNQKKISTAIYVGGDNSTTKY